jgi:hypothetical protein
VTVAESSAKIFHIELFSLNMTIQTSTGSFLMLILISFWLVPSLICVNNTHRCPAECRVASLQRNTLHRLEDECPSTNAFIKCSTSLWLNVDGTVDVTFSGDSSAQAINESLDSQLASELFYHHTQISYYGNVSEIRVNVRNSCFDIDECSRIYAKKMADQLLGYQYSELDQRVQPLIYDPTANSEFQFFTHNLTCFVDDNSTTAVCNTSCFYLSGFSQVQHYCWAGTIVALHIYTEYALPAPANSTISLDYNCNTRTSICNGPDVNVNITDIVTTFFLNPPYIASSSTCSKSQLVFVILIIFILCMIY